jgi:hypothetical protein
MFFYIRNSLTQNSDASPRVFNPKTSPRVTGASNYRSHFCHQNSHDNDHRPIPLWSMTSEHQRLHSIPRTCGYLRITEGLEIGCFNTETTHSFSVSYYRDYIASNGRVTDRVERISKEAIVAWGTIPELASRDWGKPWKLSAMTDSIPLIIEPTTCCIKDGFRIPQALTVAPPILKTNMAL